MILEQHASQQIHEDEIDLKELIKTVWNYKLFIIIFTGLVTILAIVYALIKTPIYEAKAIVKIGEYKDVAKNSKVVIDDANNLVTKLNVLYIDLYKNQNDRKQWIENISTLKKNKDFISIISQGLSNELAILEAQSVVSYIKEEHERTLSEVLENKQSELNQIDKQINKIKNINLVKLDEKMLYVKNVILKALDEKEKLTKDNLSNLENQLKITEKNLSRIKSSNSTLAAINIMEKRNLEDKINSLSIKLVDLDSQRKDILQNQIPDLQRQKSEIEKNTLATALEKRKLLELSMQESNYKNSEVVGKIITNIHPIEPKKILIIVVAFVTGFIFSIFLVFLMEFIKGIKKEEKL